MKSLLFTILLSFLSVFCLAQPGGGSMNWQPDGNSYLSLDKYNIVKTELPSLSKTVLY